MPEFLNKDQKSFTTEQANLSRRVTMCRWSVESANGRLKNKYQFCDNVVPLLYPSIVNSLFLISCALINRFSPVLLTETLHHKRLVDEVQAANELKQKVEDFELDNRRDWDKIPAVDLEGFTQLTMDNLYEITCGVYQTISATKSRNEKVCAMHNGVIRERGGKRARRAGENVLWKRTHGGIFAKNQFLCEQCTSKVRTFCNRTGFFHVKKDFTDKAEGNECVQNDVVDDSGFSSASGSEEKHSSEELPLTPTEYMTFVYLIPRIKIKPNNQHCRYNALEEMELNFYAKHINKCIAENRERRMKIRDEQYMKRRVVSFTSKSDMVLLLAT
ncbi:unnamed protein product [Orchesella dallaii]|uniref:DDE Tnp4 domain-containing protein n=1 Tax=Orchesella dallaii TaxID=48710 RepID=A0ABP1RRQ4_9HEXA